MEREAAHCPAGGHDLSLLQRQPPSRLGQLAQTLVGCAAGLVFLEGEQIDFTRVERVRGAGSQASRYGSKNLEREMKFLPPCQPKFCPEPPRGAQWQHEVKFDGYRVQLHKPAMIYSKNGSDFSKRFKPIMAAIALLPAITCVIDGELIVPDDAGSSDFKALHLRMSESYLVWCFDLLEVDGVDLREMPLRERRGKLEALLVGSEQLRYSEAFDDPDSLLKACSEHGLEGLVCKRKDMPYRPGHCDWVKVKCPDWIVRNQDRSKMFEKR